MQYRTLTALAIGFFVVVLGAMTVAVAAPGPSQSRAQATDAKLDNLHSVRPIAATHASNTISDAHKEHQVLLANSTRRGRQLRVLLFVREVQKHQMEVAAQLAAAQVNARSARRTHSVHRPSTSTNWSGGPGGVLACIRNRESRGNYSVVNPSSGTAGAYQFMPGTWNNTARSAGRPDLVGRNPAQASPRDQDAMAQHLLASQGLGPWGGGCR